MLIWMCGNHRSGSYDCELWGLLDYALVFNAFKYSHSNAKRDDFFFTNEIQALQDWLKKCMDHKGDYVEK